MISHYFPFIPLPFCVHLDGYLMLNCLFLVHFHPSGFIGPLFWILNNLALIGIILIYFFRYFVKKFWSLDANHKVTRELPRHSHIIAMSVLCQLACPCHWASILGSEWHFCNSEVFNGIFVNEWQIWEDNILLGF